MIKCFCYCFENPIFPFPAFQFFLWKFESTARDLSLNLLAGNSCLPSFMMNFIFYARALCKLDVNLYFSNYDNLLVIVVSSFLQGFASHDERRLRFKRKLGHRQKNKQQ